MIGCQSDLISNNFHKLFQRFFIYFNQAVIVETSFNLPLYSQPAPTLICCLPPMIPIYDQHLKCQRQLSKKMLLTKQQEAALKPCCCFNYYHPIPHSDDINESNNCHHQGDFIAPHAWKIVGRKKITILKGCNYSWF